MIITRSPTEKSSSGYSQYSCACFHLTLWNYFISKHACHTLLGGERCVSVVDALLRPSPCPMCGADKGAVTCMLATR